jgi:flagellar basal body-associated protein FliL
VKKLLGNKKILIGAALLLVVLGAVYKLFLASTPKPVVKKVDGALVALSEPFTLNLAGGHYGRLSVSLLVEPSALGAGQAVSGATAITLPQNDLVRSIITDNLTGIDQTRLIDRGERHALLAQLVRDLKKSTDEPVKEVLITDLAVQ